MNRGVYMIRRIFDSLGEMRKYFAARCLIMLPKVLLMMMAGYLVERIASVIIEQALGELPRLLCVSFAVALGQVAAAWGTMGNFVRKSLGICWNLESSADICSLSMQG